MVSGDVSSSDTECRCERLLSLTGEPNQRWVRPYIEALISMVLLHLAVRDGVRYIEFGEGWRLVMAAVLAVCFAASLSDRLRVAAIRVALLMLLFKLTKTFPGSANHFYLEVLTVAFLALGYRPRTDDDPAGEPALCAVSQSYRWVLVILFAWSGIRKLGQGTYFDGTFLAAEIGQESPLRDFFQMILPAEEFNRIVDTPFPGPYAFDSTFPVILSNLVVISEIAIPILLLTKRFRMVGFWLTFGSICAIEFAARELMFGALFVMLLLCFTDGKLGSRLLPVFVCYYGLLLLGATGILPLFSFN